MDSFWEHNKQRMKLRKAENMVRPKRMNQKQIQYPWMKPFLNWSKTDGSFLGKLKKGWKEARAETDGSKKRINVKTDGSLLGTEDKTEGSFLGKTEKDEAREG
jgi:hypothetical protein